MINYRSVVVVVMDVTGYSTNNILRLLYDCKRSGLTFSFTVRTKNNTLIVVVLLVIILFAHCRPSPKCITIISCSSNSTIPPLWS